MLNADSAYPDRMDVLISNSDSGACRFFLFVKIIIRKKYISVVFSQRAYKISVCGLLAYKFSKLEKIG